MPALAAWDGCRNGESFPVPFTMAFQPIVDPSANAVWGYEALVRGVDKSGAATLRLAALTSQGPGKPDPCCLR